VSDVTIREVSWMDADAVAVLFSEFNALLGVDGLPEEASHDPGLIPVSGVQMARRMRSMGGIELVFIAEEGGDLAGLCCLRLIPYIGQDEPYAEVTQLYVRPQCQRNGIGAALLQAAEKRAQAADATCVHIITGGINLNAQAFYAAQGYVSDDVVFDKYFSREEAHA
jgi:ribosomal protein S18 acetylase RimI-like enzyme